MMNWNIEKKDDKLFVTLKVLHNRNNREPKKQFLVSDVIEYLKSKKIKIGHLLKDCVVYNYQTQKRCTGTWIFSLPKTKKSTQTLENKENVLKVSNKKTTKK